MPRKKKLDTTFSVIGNRAHLFTLNGTRAEACLDLMRWAEWFEKADRRVGRTRVGDFVVSTVFLALDHSFGSGPPILFETMVFFEGDAHDELGFGRYHNWEEAVAGHARAVEAAKLAVSESGKTGADLMERLRAKAVDLTSGPGPQQDV